MSAIAAVDVALWDLKAKAAGLPHASSVDTHRSRPPRQGPGALPALLVGGYGGGGQPGLFQEQLIDYIRATVVHAGGMTHLRRIATLADLYNVKTGCHGATDLSPVCMAAALHFDLSVPNFGLQEYMRHTPETDAVRLICP